MKRVHIGATEYGGEVLSHMIALASRDAPHLVPLLRQVNEGKLLLLRYGRDFAPPPSILAGLDMPALVVIADLEGIPTGPDGWAGARDAIQWARHVVVSASAPTVDVYAAIGIAAEIGGRSVLIECPSSAIADWLAAKTVWNAPAPVHVLAPPEGESYPAVVERRGLQ